MSYSSRKAIGGMIAASRECKSAVEQAIARFDAAQSVQDVKDTLAWAKQRGGWLLRSNEDNKRLHEAYGRALRRATT